jgi:hypothetical protein
MKMIKNCRRLNQVFETNLVTVCRKPRNALMDMTHRMIHTKICAVAAAAIIHNIEVSQAAFSIMLSTSSENVNDTMKIASQYYTKDSSPQVRSLPQHQLGLSVPFLS